MSLTEIATDADDALRCPLCEYDLRGLTQNRCPECGRTFDPVVLRAAAAERKLWLFEHAKRRPIVAFLLTTLRSFAPWSFFRTLNAGHRIVRPRIAAWTAVWILLGTCSVLVPLATQVPKYRTYTYLAFRGPGPSPRPVTVTLPWRMAIEDACKQSALSPVIVLLLAVLAWPFLSQAAISVFATTLRRSGVRPGHLARCTRYALPSMLLTAGIVVVLSEMALMPPWHLLFRSGGPLVFALIYRFVSPLFGEPLAAAGLVATVHLLFAFTRYLRLPQAILTALLAEFMTWLAVLGVFTTLFR